MAGFSFANTGWTGLPRGLVIPAGFLGNPDFSQPFGSGGNRLWQDAQNTWTYDAARQLAVCTGDKAGYLFQTTPASIPVGTLLRIACVLENDPNGTPLSGNLQTSVGGVPMPPTPGLHLSAPFAYKGVDNFYVYSNGAPWRGAVTYLDLIPA